MGNSMVALGLLYKNLYSTLPDAAIKYQIMVAFMLAGNVSATVLFASYWAYRSFFTRLAQLKDI
ncbi:ABC-type iron transport system FetAB permease component [Sporomusaceae bacterium BoRhaA]|uniref:ABC transporter permease n=1 Tax=Pelorhabdus rhamnosifermentans TaxID=2772457 RepID=UPI001FEC7421|nr:ABC transporter permease [Pelorhabdus rhamnosifermentans]MBU2700845.1 ABC-type iron transport system FetAB permease component [Pelorhabdus rhamnosifermentans]